MSNIIGDTFNEFLYSEKFGINMLSVLKFIIFLGLSILISLGIAVIFIGAILLLLWIWGIFEQHEPKKTPEEEVKLQEEAAKARAIQKQAKRKDEEERMIFLNTYEGAKSIVEKHKNDFSFVLNYDAKNYLNGLESQIEKGDNTTFYSEANLDMREVWVEWLSRKGTSKEEAKQLYVKKVMKLFSDDYKMVNQ